MDKLIQEENQAGGARMDRSFELFRNGLLFYITNILIFLVITLLALVMVKLGVIEYILNGDYIGSPGIHGGMSIETVALILGYSTCFYTTLLARRLFKDYRIKTRNIVISQGILFILSFIIGQLFLIANPLYTGADDSVSQFLFASTIYPLMGWLLGGFMISSFIYSREQIFDKGLRFYNPHNHDEYLQVEHPDERIEIQMNEIEEMTILEVKIVAIDNILIRGFEFWSTKQFEAIKVHGDFPVKLDKDHELTQELRVQLKQPGVTKVRIKIAYSDQESRTVRVAEFTPLEISVNPHSIELGKEEKPKGWSS